MYGLLKENIRSKVYLIVTLACVDLRRLCKDKTLVCMVHVIHQMLILIFLMVQICIILDMGYSIITTYVYG